MTEPSLLFSLRLALRTGAFALALGLVSPAVLAGPQSVPGAPPDLKTIHHVLNRLGFGARPGDVARVQSMGVEAYIESQLYPERVDDSVLEARLAEFQTLTMSTEDLVREYFRPAEEARRAAQAAVPRSPAGPAGDNGTMRPDQPGAPARRGLVSAVQQAAAGQRLVMTELTQAKMLRAALSERQLQEVLTDFWFNHFNVFVGKGPVRQYLIEYERDAIRPHVLGHFREMLGQVAHSPAMLFYLDNWQSSTPNPPALPRELVERMNDPRLTPQQRQRLADRMRQQQQQRQMAGQPQRPQRGINENYARELMELHTLGVDGGYTQTDVMELARILTGWTIDQPRNGGGFIFRDAMHDTGTKTFLGSTFGSAGEVEGERALDLLARHPATARHISFKLAQRLIADEPPAEVVERAAKVFTSSHGDLRQVVRSILTSPEFFADAAYRAKVKTPFEFVVSAVRATGATIATAQPMVAAMQNLGMPLYGAQPPTGYGMTADTWVNTGSLLNRMTFAAALVDGVRIAPMAQPGRAQGAAPRLQASGQPGGRRGGRPQAGPDPLQIDVAALAGDTTDRSRDRLIDTLLAGQISEATERTLARAATPQQLVALALGSPEFQRR